MIYSTNNLFVSFRYGTSSVDGPIYDNIEDAIKEADLNNDNYSKMTFSNGVRPYKAITLYEAIEKVKDYLIYGEPEYQERNFR